MYGFPQDFDPTPFFAKVLDQVSFTVNTIYLLFSENISITVESCFSHTMGHNIDDVDYVRLPVEKSWLMRLLGQSVTNAVANSDGTLVLTFSNGDIFACYDDTKMYEAYRINFGGKEIVV